ncbi:MAG: hypothetical protein R3316_01580 [Rhodovibrionaceae bacterium]|nr:hypothetical protein [Rhodovibrionaceae bacterium]
MRAETPAQTLVLQATRPDPPSVIRRCLDSVESWAATQGHAYRLLEDELFRPIPAWAWEKFGDHRVVLSDLARLLWMAELLDQGWSRVFWLDSDVFVFAPEEFALPEPESLAGGCAFGREVWVQPDGRGGLTARRNVHNAASLFERDNAFLAFYIHACERILARHAPERGMAPQILGPKFLSAQHNIVAFDLIEAVGMASPLTLSGLAGRPAADRAAGRDALTLLRAQLAAPMRAVNLCLSYLGRSVDGVQVDDALFAAAMDALAENPSRLAPSRSGDVALQSTRRSLLS